MAQAVPMRRVRVPSQERAQRTCARIVEAARREFSERGYAATTTRSIAERARIATGSFYQYFADKDAVLREIAKARAAFNRESSVGQLEIAPPAGADTRAILGEMRARLSGVVSLVIAFHRQDPGLHAVLTERRHADPKLGALTSEAEHALVDRIAALLERWGQHGDHLATAFVLFGMVEGSVHAHVLGDPIVSDQRFIDALVEALVRIAGSGEDSWHTSS